MRISDWSSDVCSSDHAVQALRALQFLDPEFAQEHLEIIDNAWHHRLDAGLTGRLLEFEADAQLQEARLASPAVEADQHLVEIVVLVRSRGLVVGPAAAEPRLKHAPEVSPRDALSGKQQQKHDAQNQSIYAKARLKS